MAGAFAVDLPGSNHKNITPGRLRIFHWAWAPAKSSCIRHYIGIGNKKANPFQVG
jgi:hypothetical protein